MIELKNTEFFKDAIEVISAFIPEGNFRFSDDGLYFRALDASQVLLVDYSISKDLFAKYDIEPNFVGVDLTEFNKIIQRALPQDKIILDLDDSELKIKMESELKRTFRLPLIDVSEEEANIPKIEYKTRAIISSVSLKELLRDASLFGTGVILKVEDNKFIIESSGSQGKMSSEATTVTNLTTQVNVTSKFSLAFMQKIIRDVAQENKVTIELKEDSPMKVTYNIGKSEIKFYLAHMIL